MLKNLQDWVTYPISLPSHQCLHQDPPPRRSLKHPRLLCQSGLEHLVQAMQIFQRKSIRGNLWMTHQKMKRLRYHCKTSPQGNKREKKGKTEGKKTSSASG